MYVISNVDGIPVLTDSPDDEDVVRPATRQEIAIFNDFWGMYLDLVEEGAPESDDLDERVRRITLTKHGLSDMI